MVSQGRSSNEVPNEEHLYFAACCTLVASLVDTQEDRKHLPISSILAAVGGQLRISDFFEKAQFAAADLGRVTDDIPAVDPTSVIQSHRQAFSVTTEVYRKLSDSIVGVGLVQNNPDVLRLVWLYFLVAKAFISKKCSTSLASVSSFHLLLACMVQLGVVEQEGGNGVDEQSPRKRRRLTKSTKATKLDNGLDPAEHLCKSTGGVKSEVRRFLGMMSQTLPENLVKQIPKKIDTSRRAVTAFASRVERQYEDLLESSKECTGPDERVFVDNVSITGTQQTLNLQTMMSPPRAPTRRIREPSADGSSQFAKYVHPTPRAVARAPFYAGSGDALDALAAVASSSPRSPAILKPGAVPFKIPVTPVSAGLQAVAWLHRITRLRLEVKLQDLKPNGVSSPLELVRESTVFDVEEPNIDITNPPLRGILEKFPKTWDSIATRVKDLLNTLKPGLMQPGQRREALAMYFTSLERIVVREHTRLAHHRLQALLENYNFHKTLLACGLEATAACYGRRDVSVFPVILESFGISAFTLTKGIESFVRSLPNLPKRVEKHIEKSEYRLIESVIWEPSSPLVSALRARDESILENPEDTKPCTTRGVPEVALAILYKKILFIAGERIDALASLLGLDKVVEQIWDVTKYAVVEKWTLLVGRHLDQIILCCIYGIARVFRIPIKFKDITLQYRMLDHVNDPSFQCMIPGVYRDMCINEEERGDIIKFYNEIFIPAMKESIMSHQPSAKVKTSPVTSSPSSGDKLRQTILSSPLRRSRDMQPPTRHFGAHISVYPMSPQARAMRHSPSHLLGGSFPRTPRTRTLHAFGESPAHDHLRLSRPYSTGTRPARARPLGLGLGDKNGSSQTGASSIRRRYANMLASQGVKKLVRTTDKSEGCIKASEENAEDRDRSKRRIESEIAPAEIAKNDKLRSSLKRKLDVVEGTS